MFRTLILAIALTSPALAAPTDGVATLAAPARVAKVTGEAGSWRCDGTSCTGSADSGLRAAVAACATVAEAAGRVTAFTAGTLTFADAELARCNRHAR